MTLPLWSRKCVTLAGLPMWPPSDSMDSTGMVEPARILGLPCSGDIPLRRIAPDLDLFLGMRVIKTDEGDAKAIFSWKRNGSGDEGASCHGRLCY